jgi:hypothetical protein
MGSVSVSRRLLGPAEAAKGCGATAVVRLQERRDRPHNPRSRPPALIGIFGHKLRIVRISLARGLHNGVVEQVANLFAVQCIGLPPGDQCQTSLGIVLRKFRPALLAAPSAALLKGGRFAIEDFHMQGDADGQQLNQGARGIISMTRRSAL